MKSRKLFRGFPLLLLVCLGIVGGDFLPPSAGAFSLGEDERGWIRGGLQFEIQRVEFNPPTVSVLFRIADEKGRGLDRLGVDTPGPVDFDLILARIKPGDLQYTNYITKRVSNPATGVTADQPAADTEGTYTSLGDGVYKYASGFQFPTSPERDSTHTLSMRARRDLREFGLGFAVVYGFYDFAPSGKPVSQVRDVVRTENCYQCHDPLESVRTGFGRDVKRCVLCHTPQNLDPDSGNSLDLKVMIHKIHRGANLPSVKAGKPYQIVASDQTVRDFSTVVWPQDIRNCTTCHQKATQGDNHKTNPNRAACGSCHDNVDFATGANHPCGVQGDDSQCSGCHLPDSGEEFDLSVDGAHTIPEYSKQLPGLNAKISGVSNTRPGERVTMSFTITDNAGNLVDLSTLEALNLVLAGPTTDYTWRVDAGERPNAQRAGDGYQYTFPEPFPADARGTYAVSIRAVRKVTLRGALPGKTYTAQENAFNPVLYFGIGGSPVEPRRKVVDEGKCRVCHKDLAIGVRGLQRNPEYCVLCHNPKFTDMRSRPPDQRPVETLSFRTKVHRNHRGRKLEEEYRTFTSSGTTLWNENRFPGDQRNCAKCHLGDSYKLPLPEGLAWTDAPRFFYSPVGPIASACLGCHNGKSAAAHAYQMTAPFGEGCPSCHGEAGKFAVSQVHAR
ncbi:MAG: OmcA/MtrC family decaheme c-type cytochrome [Acidobacteria bacterium]|nr:OmcA/MtrC family decaheme c-type cytochrome [Acidobacteriota bacterium]